MAQATARILDDITAERARQDAKWGEQNHPSLDPVLLTRPGGCTPERMAEEYGIPTATRARTACQRAAERGETTWGHILVEEVAEVVSCLDDEQSMREELIQVAAVAVNWIENLDRRAEAARG